MLVSQSSIALRLIELTDSPPRRLAMALGTAQPSDEEVARIRDWLLRLEAWRYAASGASNASGRSAQSQRRTLGTLRREFRQLRWPQHLPPTTLPT